MTKSSGFRRAIADSLDHIASDMVKAKYGFPCGLALRTVIPKHKMAMPFCAFKTLTGFVF
ncbi:MAG: hypothetical protein ACKO7R_02870 [Pseudanabaena sp.]